LSFRRRISFFSPTFDWVQVEVTTHCNAACLYCPRTVYQETWQDRHLSLEIFRKLQPVFSRTRLVHLQGWGEPFLNPEFFEMVTLAKEAGCQVGTTTNGLLLDREHIARLVDSGIDTVAFSLSGTDEENNRIRKGTRLTKVLEAIQALSRKKEELKAVRPAIHVAYMLFRSGLEGVGRLPSLLQGLGVTQVVASTLDFIPSSDLQGEALIPATEGEYDDLCSRLDAVVGEGERYGMNMHYHLVSPVHRRKVCTENVQRALCISSDGAVTPCVFTDLQISQASYLLGNQSRPYQRMAFGNIHEQSLMEIWRGKAYVRFRRSFEKGDLADVCQGCPKLSGR